MLVYVDFMTGWDETSVFADLLSRSVSLSLDRQRETKNVSFGGDNVRFCLL